MTDKVTQPVPGYNEVMKTFFKRYADFTGRSRRAEFWKVALCHGAVLLLFVLCMMLIQLIIGLCPMSGDGWSVVDWMRAIAEGMVCIASLYALGVFVPSLALYIRRLHDVGLRGGWMALPMVCALVGIAGADKSLSVSSCLAWGVFWSFYSVLSFGLGTLLCAALLLFAWLGHGVWVILPLGLSVAFSAGLLVMQCRDSGPEANRWGCSPKYDFVPE